MGMANKIEDELVHASAQPRQLTAKLHAAHIGNCVFFDVGGNKFRLIAKIAFRRQIVYVGFILTHKEYDKEAWKNDCKC